MLKILYLKNKKIFLIFLIFLILLSIILLFIYNKKVINPTIEDIKKEINFGDIKLSMIVKKNTNSWDDGIPFLTSTYQFYTIEQNPKLIKEIESQVFLDHNEKKETYLEPYFILKDITGDNIPEIFILMEENGHGNKEFEILKLDDKNNSLFNIKMYGQKDNPTWIGFDKIEYKDGYVYTTNHANDMMSKTKFQIGKNTLIPLQTVSFFLSLNTDDENDCDVKIAKGNNYDYTVIKHKNDCNIWVDNLDEYFEDIGPQKIKIGEKEFKLSFQNILEADGTGERRSGNIIATTDSKEVWRSFVGGLISYKFIDVGEDGVSDIWVNSDGGGNRPSCDEEYFRYTKGTFERILFIDSENTGYSGYSVSCSEGKGLNILYGSNEYTTYDWKRTTDTRLEPVYWKCDKEKIIYKFDGKNFMEFSRTIIDRNINELDNNLSCRL